jgi:hypothetical protein
VTIKTPIATKITLLLTILLVVLYTAVGLNNWLKGSTETDSTLRMDELTNPDTTELQSRINSQLLDATRVNETEIGAADNSGDASAMDARLAGLTKNVTTQALPSNQSHQSSGSGWLVLARLFTAGRLLKKRSWH